MNGHDDSVTSDAVEGKGKRRIEFFYAADAPSLEEANVMENVFSPVVAEGITRMMDKGYAHGSQLRCLFTSPDPNGFSLTHVWFKANFPLPPHSHNTDCLYYIIAGEIRMGQRVLRAGDGFFLPADAGYSYVPGAEGVELLEFRGSSQFNIKIPDGTASLWERLASVCATNKDLWMTQRPPTRPVEAE